MGRAPSGMRKAGGVYAVSAATAEMPMAVIPRAAANAAENALFILLLRSEGVEMLARRGGRNGVRLHGPPRSNVAPLAYDFAQRAAKVTHNGRLVMPCRRDESHRRHVQRNGKWKATYAA